MAQEPRQPIHAFAASAGLLFLLLAVAGFIPGVTTHYGDMAFAGRDSRAWLFGLFQVSVAQNLLHLVLAAGLVAAARVAWSKVYLVASGVACVAVAISAADFLPVNGADRVLHWLAGLAMLGLAVLGTRMSRGRPLTADGSIS